MRTLLEYLNRDIEIVESKGKWFRINLSDFDGAAKSLHFIANNKKLYNEYIKDGIKILVKPGQEDKLSAVIEFLTDLVNSKQEDEKMKDSVEELQGIITTLSDYMEEHTDDGQEGKPGENDDE